MMTNPDINTDFRALCAEVLAFHHGEGCYNFSGLNPYDRDNAAFDAWQDIRQRLKSALAQPAPSLAVVPDAGGVIDVLIKAEAILANIVEGESPVDNGPSNAHNYFAEQCGYLESELEKCEDLLSIIRSAIQP